MTAKIEFEAFMDIMVSALQASDVKLFAKDPKKAIERCIEKSFEKIDEICK